MARRAPNARQATSAATPTARGRRRRIRRTIALLGRGPVVLDARARALVGVRRARRERDRELVRPRAVGGGELVLRARGARVVVGGDRAHDAQPPVVADWRG